MTTQTSSCDGNVQKGPQRAERSLPAIVCYGRTGQRVARIAQWAMREVMSEGIFKLLSDPVLQALLLELPVPARWLRASEQRGFGLVRQLQQPPSGRPRVMRALGPATHNLMRGAGSLLQTRVTRLRALQER